VLNMELLNKVFLIKQLHMLYMKENIPWIHLVWSLYGSGVSHRNPREAHFGGVLFSFLWRGT
jgi:hypothetical protein